MNLIESVFRYVLDASWRGGCVILLLLALRRFWRGQLPVRVLFAAWILIAARLLLPIAIPAPWSPYNLLPSRGRSREAFVPPPATPALHATPISASLPQPTTPPASALAVRANAPAPTLTWFQIAALIWLFGAAFLGALRLRARFLFSWRVHRSASAAPLVLHTTLAEVQGEFGAPPIEVLVTPAVAVPSLFGFRRSLLLFPPGLAEKLSPAELRLILAHEIGHCQRRDLMAAGLIRTAAILHWFNPLAWLALRQSQDDCEMACDEFVLRCTNASEPAAYGGVLLKMVGALRTGPRPTVALGMVDSKRQLTARIHRIARYQSATFIGAMSAVGLFGLVALFGLTQEVNAAPPAPALTTTGSVASGHGSSEADFNDTYHLDADGVFELSNVNGAISIQTWDRPEVRVEGRKHGATDEAVRDLDVSVDSQPKRLSIEVHYPDSGLHFWGKSSRGLSVDFTITLPKGASIGTLSIVNGSIMINGVRGSVNAASVNGSIHAVGLAESATLKSVNGSLYAEFPGLPAKNHLRFNTVNGSITVRLPKSASASVEAATINGRVKCDLPMQATRMRRNNLNGQIGDGSGSFTARSVNGSIEIQAL